MEETLDRLELAASRLIVDGLRSTRSRNSPFLEAVKDRSTYRHTRDDLIDQVGDSLGHAPGTGRKETSAIFARKRDQLLMGALGTANSQETVVAFILRPPGIVRYSMLKDVMLLAASL